MKKDILSGASEKLIIPSSEYLNRDQKLHEVFPATRSTLLYSIYFVLKPTQAKIPLEKRLYSDSSNMTDFINDSIK